MLPGVIAEILSSALLRFSLISSFKRRVGDLNKRKIQGFGSAFFFADPDPDPGKNLHADPDPDLDPDPGGIRGRGLGVKGKMNFFFEFFSRFR